MRTADIPRQAASLHLRQLGWLPPWVAVLWLTQHGTASAQNFAIRSISFPLIGSNYLDDHPGWDPVTTVIQQMRDLGVNDVKIVISVGLYDSPLANLPNPDATASVNPSDDKILDFLRRLRAAGLQVTLWPNVVMNFDPNANLLDTVHSQPTDF